MTFGLRCSGPARRPHPASLPVRVPSVESLPSASFSFRLTARPCGSATVAVIGSDWLLSSNEILPMLGTPRRDPFQNRPAAYPEDVAGYGTQLDPALLQQARHLVANHAQHALQVYSRPCQPAPTPLLRPRDEAILQISRVPAVGQPPCVPEIRLPSTRRPGLQRMRQMQFKVCFQPVPHWPPVLRRRFHHHFAHLMILQPGRQVADLGLGRAELPLHVFSLRCANYHRQHLLMHVDPCYPSI